MKKTKRIAVSFISLMLTVSMFPSSVFAEGNSIEKHDSTVSNKITSVERSVSNKIY